MMLARTLLAVVVLAASGWLGYGAARAAAGPATSGSEVAIDNFTFGPATLTVPAGTPVTWTNRDDIPHTVVMPDPAQPVKSSVMDTDDHFTFTFSRRGTYKYFCSLHPHMQGTVVVE